MCPVRRRVRSATGRGPARRGLRAATTLAALAALSFGVLVPSAGRASAAPALVRGWEVSATGHVTPVGGASSYGSATVSRRHLVVGVESTPDGRGYWLVTSDGRVLAFGDARFWGSADHRHLASRVVAMAPTPSGHGYWLVEADGTVLAYGNATCYGSAHHVAQAVVGMAATPDGYGYWLVTAAGAVYHFGDARADPSASPLAGATVVGISRASGDGGYWLYEADGAVRGFGTAKGRAPGRLTPATSPSTVAGAAAADDATSSTWTTIADRHYIVYPRASASSLAPVGPEPTIATAAEASEAVGPLPFSPTSFWNTPLPADTPLAPGSSALVADFVEQYHDFYGTVGINTTSYSSPVYTVGPDQPTVTVTPRACLGYVDNGLAAQLSAVPIPAGAFPASGTDADLVVYQPATDTEWELWEANDSGGSWTACAGGEITDVSASAGVFPNPFGVAASGLSLLAGQIHFSDIAAGSIDHVLDVQVPLTEAGVFVVPADRTDGFSTASDAIPEGTRFRLDPDLDLSSLGLTPAGLEIARALQTYGMVVSDTGGAVAFFGQDPAPQVDAGGPDPYAAWFGATPSYDVLAGIPWNDLRVVPPSAS